jgi:hypothetical protein
VIDLYTLRQKYLTAEAQFSRLVILDTQISMIRETSDLLQDKARRLKMAMVLLVFAVVLVGAGLAID